jgi:hypothetical protein
MVNVTIVCNPEEPGTEFGQAQERAGRHVCPYERILGDVIGESGIATAQRQQEPP